ncbi:hypothetical protein LINGRAHAP2_LOCUS6893 [Linum grandiflorum]
MSTLSALSAPSSETRPSTLQP